MDRVVKISVEQSLRAGPRGIGFNAYWNQFAGFKARF